ncbi:MAG TPA: transporter, partial [Verrucomicrobiae bacterium]|nr:transporter [Verrucomicrobiae bacterium]
LGWTNSADMKYDVRLGIYAPTGNYDKGRLANPGRNYWTFEPAISYSWLSSKIGTEVTVFSGFDINTENEDTHYQSGTSWHLDGTVAQHLPLFGGFVGVGAEGFVYEQITGDSGSGATLGSFEGHVYGVGPVVSYIHKIGKVDFAGEVKWLPEVDAEKRLKGNFVWVKLGVVF